MSKTVTVYRDLCSTAWWQTAGTESSHAPKRNPCPVAQLQRVMAKGSCVHVFASVPLPEAVIIMSQILVVAVVVACECRKLMAMSPLPGKFLRDEARSQVRMCVVMTVRQKVTPLPARLGSVVQILQAQTCAPEVAFSAVPYRLVSAQRSRDTIAVPYRLVSARRSRGTR